MTSAEADEFARAELDVAQSKAKLSQSLRHVEASSTVLARRLKQELTRSVGVVAAVAGAALLLGVGLAVVRHKRRQRSWFFAERPSALGAAAKTVGLLTLRFVARRVAEEAVRRWVAPVRA